MASLFRFGHWPPTPIGTRFRTSRLEEAETHPPSTSTTATDVLADAADVVLPILLPLHSKGRGPYDCGTTVNRNAVQDLEAASWMVGKINSNGDFLPGLKLVLRVVDTCSSTPILIRDVSTVLESLAERNLRTVFVSSGSPEQTEATSSLLSRFNITLISVDDVAQAQDPKKYRYQIPVPIEKVADAAVRYLDHLDWKYVSVVSSDSEARAARAFRKNAESASICLAMEASAADDLDLVISRLVAASATGARAVVLWTNSEDTLRFLEALGRARARSMPAEVSDLIVLHGGGAPLNFDGLEEEALGAVLLRPRYGRVRDFEAYYERLGPEQDRFLAQLWEQSRTCGVTGDCSLQLEPSRSLVDVMQAVATAAAALGSVRREVCGPSLASDACARLLEDVSGEVLDRHVRLARTPRVGDAERAFGFAKDGGGDLEVDLWNVRRSGAGITPQRVSGCYCCKSHCKIGVVSRKLF